MSKKLIDIKNLQPVQVAVLLHLQQRLRTHKSCRQIEIDTYTPTAGAYNNQDQDPTIDHLVQEVFEA